MNEIQVFLPNILLTYLTYLVIIASPGPATLATMSISMNRGRRAGVIFGLGIVTGSIIWALLAFFGVAKLFQTQPFALLLLKIIGAIFLLWLAYKALKSAMSIFVVQSHVSLSHMSPQRIYLQALILHITNPKAVLTWLTIVSVGLKENTPSWVIITIFIGCVILVLSVFMLYAYLFSSRLMISKYQQARRPIEACMALVCGLAGVTLLLEEF